MRHLLNARSISLVAILFVALGQFNVIIAKQPLRIRFERGKSSAAVHGHIAGFDTQDYVVEARAGQQMDIRVTSPMPAGAERVNHIDQDHLAKGLRQFGERDVVEETGAEDHRLAPHRTLRHRGADHCLRAFQVRCPGPTATTVA